MVGGLLGSDVLATFGSLHLDFDSNELTLGAVPPPGAPSIPMTVFRSHGEVIPQAAFTVPSSATPAALTVDTGASGTYLATTTASALGITPDGTGVTLASPGCDVTARPASVTGAKLGPVDVPLPSVLVGPSQIALHDPEHGAGVIGEDVLSSSGSVWLDYAGSRLVLG